MVSVAPFLFKYDESSGSVKDLICTASFPRTKRLRKTRSTSLTSFLLWEFLMLCVIVTLTCVLCLLPLWYLILGVYHSHTHTHTHTHTL